MTRARIIRAAVALALLSSPLWADTGSQSSPASGTGCIGIIVLYFCYKRKEQEIGGALLYYYIQLYLGTLLTAVMFLRSLESYHPGSWSAAPHLYPWFLASALPGVLVMPAQLFVAERLRLSRNDRFLQWLRAVLWAGLAAALTGGAIDAVHFREYLIFDFIGLVWPCIWLPYFYRSTRVRRVFTTKDWHVPDPTAVLGLGAALRQTSASGASPGESGDHTIQGESDLSLRQGRRQEEATAAPRLSVQELLAVEAQLNRSFTVCVAALFTGLGWVVYLHGAELEATSWGLAVLTALAAVLLATYVWFAWAVGRAARAVGGRRALYLTWVLVAPFLALLPIPVVSVVLAASPLSLKFLLSSQVRSQIHDRTFEDA
jgi:hypothetical protein